MGPTLYFKCNLIRHYNERRQSKENPGRISKTVHCAEIALEIDVRCKIITLLKEIIQLIFLILVTFLLNTL